MPYLCLIFIIIRFIGINNAGTRIINSLIEAILYRKEKNQNGRVFVFLDENDHAREVTNEQFYNDMQRYARDLIAQGIRPGEIVLLALDHGYELLRCF